MTKIPYQLLQLGTLGSLERPVCCHSTVVRGAATIQEGAHCLRAELCGQAFELLCFIVHHISLKYPYKRNNHSPHGIEQSNVLLRPRGALQETGLCVLGYGQVTED